MGKPDHLHPGPKLTDPTDYPSHIHREHLDPLAASRGFLYGFFAGMLWMALVWLLLG
ncbi:MAG: hypothetical protein KAJ55_10065 [Anaerolineales bacterium]|nr:hypothetical protein [Anaerolineales bacterium]